MGIRIGFTLICPNREPFFLFFFSLAEAGNLTHTYLANGLMQRLSGGSTRPSRGSHVGGRRFERLKSVGQGSMLVEPTKTAPCQLGRGARTAVL